MRSFPLSNLTFRLTLLAALTCVLAAASACGGSGDDDGEDLYAGVPSPVEDRSEHPWKIVVSMPLFADFAREMGGDQVAVTTLIPPGADPTTYEPDESQAAALQDADIVFVNGLGLDDPTISFIEAHRTGRLFMVDFPRNVPSPTHEQPVDAPIYAKDVGDDAHLYLDPVLVHIYAETVAHSLIIIDGLNEQFYDGRYQRYKVRLQELREKMAADLGTIPEANRGAIVMPHNSLIHLANRFGLTVAATIADDGEDGVRQAIADKQPLSVFTEAGVPGSEALEGIADETGLETCLLYTDALDDAEMTYLEMMEHDAQQLVSCLGG